MAASLCILLLAVVVYCNAQVSLPSDCAGMLPCAKAVIAETTAFHDNYTAAVLKCLTPNGCTLKTNHSDDACVVKIDNSVAMCLTNATGNVIQVPNNDFGDTLKMPKITCASKSSNKPTKQCLKALVKSGKAILKKFKTCFKPTKPKQCKKLICKAFKTCKKATKGMCKPAKGFKPYYTGKLFGFC